MGIYIFLHSANFTFSSFQFIHYFKYSIVARAYPASETLLFFYVSAIAVFWPWALLNQVTNLQLPLLR